MRRLCPKLFHWLRWQRWPYHERQESLLSLHYCVITICRYYHCQTINRYPNSDICQSCMLKLYYCAFSTSSSQELSPKNQTEMKVLMAHQVSTKTIRCWVCQEDDTLGKSIACTIYISLLQCSLVWCLKLSFVHFHKTTLFTETSDGADIVQRLTRYLEKDRGHLHQSFEKIFFGYYFYCIVHN